MAEAALSPIIHFPNAETRWSRIGESAARLSAVPIVSSARDSLSSATVTGGDLRELVRLLRKHPEGLLALERQDAFHKRILAPDKLAAYRAWQVITQEGELLRLTPFGEQLAAALAAEIVPLRALLLQVPHYRQTLEWLRMRSITLVTDQDLVRHWNTSSMFSCDSATLKAQAISFFHLCQAADFGIVTLGKRGQPSRLRVELTALREFALTPSCL